MYNEYRPANTDNLKIKHHYLTIMDSRNIPREIFQTSLGPGPQAAYGSYLMAEEIDVQDFRDMLRDLRD